MTSDTDTLLNKDKYDCNKQYNCCCDYKIAIGKTKKGVENTIYCVVNNTTILISITKIVIYSLLLAFLIQKFYPELIPDIEKLNIPEIVFGGIYISNLIVIIYANCNILLSEKNSNERKLVGNYNYNDQEDLKKKYNEHPEADVIGFNKLQLEKLEQIHKLENKIYLIIFILVFSELFKFCNGYNTNGIEIFIFAMNIINILLYFIKGSWSMCIDTFKDKESCCNWLNIIRNAVYVIIIMVYYC